MDYKNRNFTVKAVILSLLLAVVLAAANAYLALKISTTISASIPAAVLAIGIFRLFKQHSVYEFNLVQTAASAGEGMAAASAFVLPALVIFHFWTSFNYWMTVAIIGLGGVLGVFLSIPLRRILLNLPELKYPEGTAIGNVLKVSTNKTEGLLKYLLTGAGAGGAITFLQQGMQVVGGILPLWMKVRGTLVGMTLGFGPAAFAAGFIIGPEVGCSLLIGLIIGWGLIIPLLSHHFGIPMAPDHYTSVMMLSSHHLRYIGVGCMLVGGVWSFIRLIKPISEGMRLSVSVLNKKHLVSEQERDIPLLWMGLGVLLFSAFIFAFLAYIFNHLNIALGFNVTIIALIVTLLFIMIMGFFLTTICGYITGVIGSTNSPLSSMIITSVLLLGLIYVGILHLHNTVEINTIVGLVLLVSGMVGAVAAVGTENFQDLKAGQMIKATPWKQQVMLVLGVITASFVLAPVFNLLLNAYGIGGVLPHPGMNANQMLAAPQAVLIGTLASAIVSHQVDWSPILWGAGIALVVLAIDGLICRRYCRFRITPLAVGTAIYLPPELISVMVLGSVIHLVVRYLAKKSTKNEETQQKVIDLANMSACGMVAGSALMGVFLAIPFALSGNPDVLTPAFALSPHFTIIGEVLGVLGIILLVKVLLRHVSKEKLKA